MTRVAKQNFPEPKDVVSGSGSPETSTKKGAARKLQSQHHRVQQTNASRTKHPKHLACHKGKITKKTLLLT